MDEIPERPLYHYRSADLSEIVKLSVSSYGETDEEVAARKSKLVELGTGHEHFGYEISDVTGLTDYMLTAEDFIEKSPGCCGCCVGVVPTLDELNFMLATKKTGSRLIHIYSAENELETTNYNEISPNLRTCVKIVINAETKGVVRLDFPPNTEGTHGDFTLEMIPVAVIDQDAKLAFIFRPSALDSSGDVTEIITADGTGFVVAKVGPAEALLINSMVWGGPKNKLLSSKAKRDHFCVLFLDRLLGRSLKQLLFSVSTVFFYLWLVHKAYKNKDNRPLHQNEDKTDKVKGTRHCCNCTIS